MIKMLAAVACISLMIAYLHKTGYKKQIATYLTRGVIYVILAVAVLSAIVQLF